MDELGWVLDEPAFPGTAATVKEIRRGAGAEKGEARAGAVGGYELGSSILLHKNEKALSGILFNME